MRLCVSVLVVAACAVFANVGRADTLLEQARAAAAAGQLDEAIKLVTRALEAAPNDAQAFAVRARLYLEKKQPDKAIADFDRVIAKYPQAAQYIDRRGDAYLMLGKMTEAVADFDRFLALAPAKKPEHWRRGIALYYAGRYKDGVDQFELHQTVNRNDVENAVWHYLCNAKVGGPEKARSALIPIRGDARVPLMTVHALFAGKAKPEDVLKEAAAGNVSAERRKNQLFYAHLYLGLYYESVGNAKASLDHMTKAATEYAIPGYMGDVARVHVQLRKAKAGN
jgi:lipoprotein NlpI